MLKDFTVARRSGGLVASLDDDRVYPVGEDGADPESAGGGSPLPEDDAHLDDVGGADDGAADDDPPDRRAGARDDDDEDTEDDEVDGALPVDEQLRRLRGALKKQKKRNTKLRTDPDIVFARQLRQAGVDIRDLYSDARSYRQMHEMARQNPQLRRLLNGTGDADEPPARGAARRPAVDPEEEFRFDESVEALGFDPNESRSHRVLADGLKRAAKAEFLLTRALKRIEALEGLAPRVEGLDRTIRTESQQRVQREWNNVAQAAMKQITNEKHRKAFADLMLGAYQRDAGKRSPAQIAKHYLDLIGVDAGTAHRAGAAAAAAGNTRQRQQTAERVTQLPRPGGTGSPAPARNTRETLADVRRRITGARR